MKQKADIPIKKVEMNKKPEKNKRIIEWFWSGFSSWAIGILIRILLWDFSCQTK
jgi:hypothetical protein